VQVSQLSSARIVVGSQHGSKSAHLYVRKVEKPILLVERTDPSKSAAQRLPRTRGSWACTHSSRRPAFLGLAQADTSLGTLVERMYDGVVEQIDLTPGHIYQAAASNGLHCITLTRP
jgi:hypothetical protein